jgi:hypothetical protein
MLKQQKPKQQGQHLLMKIQMRTMIQMKTMIQMRMMIQMRKMIPMKRKRNWMKRISASLDQRLVG